VSGGGDQPPEPGSGPAPSEVPEAGSGAGPIDASRVRSFIGLSIGLVGPRANLAVSGVLITLFVQQRASSALAVTFALTADRLVSWLTYPVAGRLSDRTRSRVGRRTPYMAGSLIVLGAATWAFTLVKGYWLLVLLILVAGQAAATFTLTNVAVVPEVFGRSRWIKALLLTTVLGTVASLAIKGTVIASWKQNDPATFNLPFQVAGGIMIGVGIVVFLLVREAPAASFGAEADRKERARPALDELRDILAGPNAKVLVGGSLLFWSGVGSTAYVAILFFQRILHAGASAQTVAGLVTGLPVFFIGIALGIPLSRRLSPMQLAIGAPLVGAVLAGVQYFDTHLWQAVVLAYIGAPFIGAYVIVMAPLLLRLLPRAGGLGERLGVLFAPFNLCSVILAYVAAIVIDATGNYRLIWLFPAATGLAHATVNCWLKYPARKASDPDMVKRLWEWSVVQAESMAETGIVTGLLAAPLLGVVTKEDADSAVVIDMARNILGNPYADDPDDAPTALGTGSEPDGIDPDGSAPPGGTAPGQPVSAGTPGPSAQPPSAQPPSAQPPSAQPPSEGGAGGVTGVRQVGGGPLVGRAMGDQKSGRGPTSSSSSGTSSPEAVAGSAPPGGSTGVSEAGLSGESMGGRRPSGPSAPSGLRGRTGAVPNGGVASAPTSDDPAGAGAGGGVDGTVGGGGGAIGAPPDGGAGADGAPGTGATPATDGGMTATGPVAPGVAGGQGDGTASDGAGGDGAAGGGAAGAGDATRGGTDTTGGIGAAGAGVAGAAAGAGVVGTGAERAGTPDDTAPDDTAPDDTASDDTASEDTAATADTAAAGAAATGATAAGAVEPTAVTGVVGNGAGGGPAPVPELTGEADTDAPTGP